MTRDLLRIANAGGYWGDDPYALRRQVEGPLPLDVISIDYLAEVTMSILQKQRLKDPGAGYARDFVSQVEPLLDTLLERRIRVITNAGGVNPAACAEALAAVARAKGLRLRIALVTGDDIAPRLGELRARGVALRNLETGESFDPVAGRVLAANAYFGALPVAEALKSDPDIVICGRVTDTGITLAPLIHAFGWAADDWDRLAHGIVAGHIIECGAQATGGNFTDWRKVPSFVDVGFPLVECAPDGSFVVTKQPGSGGLVTPQTVREQLLYEMGDPQAYLTPDAIADFSTIRLEASGPDRVRVSGVKGRPATDLLKVSVAYADGFKATGALIVSGPDARAKAEVFAQVFWQRCRSELERAGLPPLEDTGTEFVGDDATHRGLTPAHRPSEILLRLSARGAERRSLDVYRKLLPSMILSGPSGVAVTGGAPAISDVVSYWPALMPQEHARPEVTVLEERGTGRLEPVSHAGPLDWPVTKGGGPAGAPVADAWPAPAAAEGAVVRVPLMRIAHARSGDKGDTANIGLIGRSPACYAWLRDHVSAERVKGWFGSICRGEVVRHAVPNLWALNFLLEGALGGGGTRSLFIDAQGKTLSQALLRCVVEVPEALLGTIRLEDAACPGELDEGGGPRVIEIPGFPVTKVRQPGRHVRLEELPHGVMRLVLARPEVRNAFDAAMISELAGALGALAQAPQAEGLRLLLMQGEGGAFCAGGDLAYMKAQAEATPEENLEDARALGRVFHRLAALPAPVLCHVQGAAVGGGLGLAACADFVLADAAAVFATSEVRLGLVPGLISPYVVRRLGVANAAPLLLTGRRVSAAEAQALGLVQRVLAPGEDPGAALAGLLGEFLAAGPEAARRTKRLLLEVAPLPDARLADLTAHAIAEARASAEGQEGLRAFFAKTRPPWAP